MKFINTFMIAAMATAAIAAPYECGSSGGNNPGNGGTGGGNGPSCAGGQTVNCCNTSKSKQSTKGGFLGLLGVVLQPGQCSPLVGILSNCGNNVAQCCSNSQGGLININLGQCVALPF